MACVWVALLWFVLAGLPVGPSISSWRLARLLRGRLGLCASRLLRVLRVLRAWCPAPQVYKFTGCYTIEGETHGYSHALLGQVSSHRGGSARIAGRVHGRLSARAHARLEARDHPAGVLGVGPHRREGDALDVVGERY